MINDDDRVVIHCLNELRVAYHRTSSERDSWKTIATSLAEEMRMERQRMLEQIDNLKAEIQRLEQAVKY